jgi:CubicO group peptidase (beta-lactamase class C family)
MHEILRPLAFLFLLGASACSTDGDDGIRPGEHPDPLPQVPRYQYAVPDQLSDGLTTDHASSRGLNLADLTTMVREVKEGRWENIHSILVFSRGALVLEEYFTGKWIDGTPLSGDRNVRVSVQSVTKSVTSAVVGIALDEGVLPNIAEPIVRWFPTRAEVLAPPEREPIRLRHLLNMTAGLSWDEWSFPYSDSRNSHFKMNRSPNPVSYVVSRDRAFDPGNRFVYNSGLPITLGEIVRIELGEPFDTYAERVLFEPLGINEWSWERYFESGVVQAGGGLYLRARDMLKIGVLFEQGGTWDGARIVSEEWVDQSTIQQAPDTEYGYQWWTDQYQEGERSFVGYHASGVGGQFIFVVPELELVAVFTGGNTAPSLFNQPFEILRRYLITGSQ